MAKKCWSWALPLKSALRDSKIKRFVALVWSMLALTPVIEEIITGFLSDQHRKWSTVVFYSLV